MRKVFLLSLAILFVMMTACRKEKDQLTVKVIEGDPGVLIEIEMKGVVKDEGGNPVAGAEVQMAGQLTSSNSNGEFRFTTTEVAQSGVLVKAVRQGYFRSSTLSRAQADSRSYTSITLMEKGPGTTLNASIGGVVVANGGATLNFQAGSFREPNGATYNGAVKVYARWIDPTADNVSELMPGALVGAREEGDRAALSTFGMITFELEGSNGEGLLLDTQMGATLEFPIPSALETDAPNEIPFWFFDETEEQWLEMGKGLKQGDKYQGTATGPGVWNCDIPLDPVFLEGVLLNADQTLASFVRVEVEDLNTNFLYGGYTDSLGYFGGYVPKDAPLRLTSEDLCDNPLLSLDIGPYSADTVTLDTTSLDDTVMSSWVQVNGQLVDCNGMPVTNGHVTLGYPGNSFFFPLASDGAFVGAVYFNCTSNRPDITVQGYDLDARLRSTDFVVSSGSGNTDLGMITVCEAPEDSMSLRLNGVDFYHIPTTYTIGVIRPGQMEVFAITRGGVVWAAVDDYSGPGLYDSDAYLTVLNFSNFAPTYPQISAAAPDIEILITADDGTFISGTVSGDVVDVVSGANINVAGSFKARKKL